MPRRIYKGVPIPSPRPTKYLELDRMEVCSCFFVEDINIKNAWSILVRKQKATGKKFKARTMEDVVKIWRDKFKFRAYDTLNKKCFILIEG